MNTVIRTALASFGMSGAVFHAPLLKVHPGFKITKVLERTKSLAALSCPDAETVRAYNYILNARDVDLVIVNTPDRLHFPMAKQALEAGKHVVVEKPFTQTAAEADELIHIAASKGLILTVFQNRRWDGDFLTVRKIVETGMLGRLVEFEARFDRYRNYIQPNTWKEDGAINSGVLYNLGSHMIDQAVTLFGMPESVSARTDVFRDGGAATDFYDVRFRYPGLAVTLKCSYLVREPGPRYSLHGTLGSFHKYGIDPQEERLKRGENPDAPNWGQEAPEHWGKINTDINGLHICGTVETLPGNYLAFYDNVYDALVNNAPLSVEPRLCRNVISILEKISGKRQER
ncbi:MAG: Gfo/Idh/MocA family oxidoreductase [Bacteroidales bacterium]|jgi:predicted dehydrogenase|nr:Gfo/Idh/MocA family oxidoreductase [Bacteroidales bacterium]